MRTFLVLFLALLASCAQEAPEASALAAAQGWKELAATRLVVHEDVILADKAAPIQHRQLARAFSRMVNDCTLDRRQGRTWHTPAAMEMDFSREETWCAHRIINQTLVQGGSDRAYEAALAAKSIEPSWFQVVMPSHIAVD